MAKEPKNLNDLFHDTLKDIYFAEKKILSTLPKMVKAAQSADLKEAFEKHRGETEGHVARLEKVFAAIEKKPQAKTCDAIVGITDEGADIMKGIQGYRPLSMPVYWRRRRRSNTMRSPATGRSRTWAQELGLEDAVRLLDQTLEEEKKTDATLTEDRRSRGQPASGSCIKPAWNVGGLARMNADSLTPGTQDQEHYRPLIRPSRPFPRARY